MSAIHLLIFPLAVCKNVCLYSFLNFGILLCKCTGAKAKTSNYILLQASMSRQYMRGTCTQNTCTSSRLGHQNMTHKKKKNWKLFFDHNSVKFPNFCTSAGGGLVVAVLVQCDSANIVILLGYITAGPTGHPSVSARRSRVTAWWHSWPSHTVLLC